LLLNKGAVTDEVQIKCLQPKYPSSVVRVLIQIVMMQHVLEWVSHLQSPTVTWREKKKNKWIFKPLSSFAPVTNLLVPSRAMGASNLFKKVCHHFPTSITWWETANLVCITNTDCRR
jgi:hypothetical protein